MLRCLICWLLFISSVQYVLQELLFKCIQDGVYSFPEKEWSTISDEAQDLVQHLLVRDPHHRYTADAVLAHPWIHMQESLPNSQLATPYLLSRYVVLMTCQLILLIVVESCCVCAGDVRNNVPQC